MSHADYWYALQVAGGREIALVEEIEKALGGVGAAYCPVVSIRKKPSRHVSKPESKDVPLFSKYLFVKFGSTFQNWGRVTDLKHVDGFIRANGYPLPIRPEAIERIRADVNSGAFNDEGLEGKIQIGDHIKVALHDDGKGFSSPWRGFDGIFHGLGRNHVGIVELSLFGRSTRVEVPTELLEVIGWETKK